MTTTKNALEAALTAHSASDPFVRNVAIINDCGDMKIEKFEMLMSLGTVSTRGSVKSYCR